MAPAWRRPAVALGALVVLAVGLSRIVLGVHWTSDVLGGWLLSLAWVLAVLSAFRLRLHPASYGREQHPPTSRSTAPRCCCARRRRSARGPDTASTCGRSAPAALQDDAVPLSRRRLLLGAGAGVAALAVGSTTDLGQRAVDRLVPPDGRAPTGEVGPLVEGRAAGRCLLGRRLPARCGGGRPAAGGPRAARPRRRRPGRLRRARAAAPPGRGGPVRARRPSCWRRPTAARPPTGTAGPTAATPRACCWTSCCRPGAAPATASRVTGWSMGGYGALLLATRLPARVLAVVADAPALWRRADEGAGGLRRAGTSPRTTCWAGPGRCATCRSASPAAGSDPFAAARELADALPDAERVSRRPRPGLLARAAAGRPALPAATCPPDASGGPGRASGDAGRAGGVRPRRAGLVLGVGP